MDFDDADLAVVEGLGAIERLKLVQSALITLPYGGVVEGLGAIERLKHYPGRRGVVEAARL